MPARALPNLGLQAFFDLGEDGWNDEVDLNFLKLSVLVQPVVMSKVAAEPGSPTEGDRHILDETHATHPNEIAVYDDGTWKYIVPDDGWVLYNIETGEEERLTDGIWMPQPSAIREYVDAAIGTVIGGGEGAAITGIVSGLGVVYTGVDLDWSMAAGSFYINGDPHTAVAQTLSLDAADATNPRIDALVVDDTGTFTKITGTPAVTPSQPTIDPATQLFLTFVLVPAAAVDLPDIVDEAIYLENTEWTTSTTGSGWNANSSTDPYAGSKAVEATALTNGSSVRFARASDLSFDGDGNLNLRIKSKATWNSKRSLTIQWYLNGSALGSPVSFKSGTFGFDSSNTADDQLVVINKDVFAVPAGSDVDELRIIAAGSGGAAIGCHIDNIILQISEGTTTGSPVVGLTQEQADARYARRANNLSDLTDAVAARANLGVYGLSVVTTDADDYTVTAADVNKYIRLTDAGTKLITVQDNSDEALPDNGEWHFRVIGGDATFVEDTSVTINPPVGGSLVVEDGGTVTLKRVAVDEFDLIGVTVAP